MTISYFELQTKCMTFYIVNRNDLCISGADNTFVDGTYQYCEATTDPKGLIWYYRVNNKYLYASYYNRNVWWSVGSSYHESAYMDIACIASC